MRSLLLILFACNINAFDILGFFTIPVRSHYVFMEPLITELINRGHNLTIYSVFLLDQKPKPNLNIIDIGSCFFKPAIGHINIQNVSNPTTLQTLKALKWMIPEYEKISNCTEVMNLLESENEYDAFISDLIFSEWHMLFSHKFKTPFINIFPNILYPFLNNLIGAPDNPSYMPVITSGFIAKMNFFERLTNFYMYVFLTLSHDYLLLKETNSITRRLLRDDNISVADIVKNTSLTLINVDFFYRSAIPLLPNVIPIAGINIKNSTSLPQNIEKFINESEHGVVYFCMGSLLRGETFPEEKRNAFLYAFSKIPQRVLWKWEGDVLPGKSDNIMISKWMPQRDILAHPNVKLFISHGGLLGTSEAVYEGVPVLGIPIFGDQRTNIKSLEANGAGELLDYNEISKEVVLEKITRLTTDPKYRQNAKELSARYRDRPMSPLDTAVYWTEYVIRHKGAPHLRTAAADMPWYQYLLLDVIAFLVFVFISILVVIYYSIKFTYRFVYNLICGKKSSSKTSEKKKRN